MTDERRTDGQKDGQPWNIMSRQSYRAGHKNIEVIHVDTSACILISMFNLITINLKYSCSFIYPVNVFQTSIKIFIVLIQGNWTIKKYALKFHCNNKQYITHIKEITDIQCCNIKQGNRWVCCPLNVFQTYIKNLNRKLFHGIC